MKCYGLHHWCFLMIKLLYVLSVISERMQHTNASLSSGNPCSHTDDVTVGLKPGYRAREMSHLYVKVNKNIPANSVVKALFDNEVIFLGEKENKRNVVQHGKIIEVRFTNSKIGFSFMVKGTRQIRPNLVSFSVNDVEYCNKGRNRYRLDQEKCGKFGIQCGRRIVNPNWVTDPISGSMLPHDTGFVVDSEVSGLARRGEWPWHAALYLRHFIDPDELWDFFGGTLISHTFVLTHAVYLSYTEPKAENIFVHLGKYKFQQEDTTFISKEVVEIIVPQNFTLKSLFDDIALLRLKSPVQFTDFIRPACLWHRRRSDPTNVNNIVGVLAGWGFTNGDTGDTIPQSVLQINLPMVSDETCIKSYPDFYGERLNGKNFCAGFHNKGSSPCNGDQGGALLVFIPDAVNDKGEIVSGSWFVRGVMSLHFPRKGYQIVCDENQYAIFADIDKYADWLDSYLDA